MRWLVLVALSSGCDLLFGLTPLNDAGAHGDSLGPGVDTPGDTDRPSPPCTPHAFSGTPTLIIPNVTYAALPASLGFAIVIQSGSVTEQDPIGTSGAPIISGTWSSPGLTPDGTELFLTMSGPTIYEALSLGTDTWTIPVAALPTGLQASTPANIGGVLHMVVQDGADFTEYTRANGAWTRGPTSTSIQLTGVSGTISAPSLSPDGLILVFSLASNMSAKNGVYFVQRTALSSAFDATTGALAAGRMLVTAGVVPVSNYLTPDCLHLYLVDPVNANLVRYP